ncbi:MAG: adenylosuccinate synthase [Lentisphaerae bacterium RIFOXYC12_FULL_60_16]|nr:MAG: adenylosuccinate synthase [Lentisphaerae bacterium RIFOXYC12_FULL_60_16]OGV72866.1 MAG: adenylosuccinate synthase [Lentisphaerae bacterium RIFOXYA12_FULL_60_10]OGV86259.1 MAG: adenylosuccinate synthase [Lentisphaerae bacterium RIFOXYB12_FULL_60_10]
MPSTILVGAQWGDEGKGKIIDVLASEADLVVRFQGGNNAGHTVKVGDAKYVLHLIPSGILHPDKVCVIGNGLVVDPLALLVELDGLEQSGIKVAGRLFISDRCHVVLPYHRVLDEGREAGRASDRIGTTKRGIGPAYSAKTSRTGIRMGDLVSPGFEELLAIRIEDANRAILEVGGKPVDGAVVLADYRRAAERLKPYITDTLGILHEAVKADRKILFEGAQGTMLDIDYGTYPFVTSSNTTAGGACTGAGLGPGQVQHVIGVIKAYTTRVGDGPFPTELKDSVGETLGRVGVEFGATTGRPRRCGWFDAVVARYACRLNGFTTLAVTKLDVLDSLKTIKICVAYECDGKLYDTVPASVHILERCRPVYEEMGGWQCATSTLTRYEDLPDAAYRYVARLCELTGAPLGILSVGPRRDSTMRVGL